MALRVKAGKRLAVVAKAAPPGRAIAKKTVRGWVPSAPWAMPAGAGAAAGAGGRGTALCRIGGRAPAAGMPSLRARRPGARPRRAAGPLRRCRAVRMPEMRDSLGPGPDAHAPKARPARPRVAVLWGRLPRDGLPPAARSLRAFDTAFDSGRARGRAGLRPAHAGGAPWSRQEHALVATRRVAAALRAVGRGGLAAANSGLNRQARRARRGPFPPPGAGPPSGRAGGAASGAHGCRRP